MIRSEFFFFTFQELDGYFYYTSMHHLMKGKLRYRHKACIPDYSFVKFATEMSEVCKTPKHGPDWLFLMPNAELREANKALA